MVRKRKEIGKEISPSFSTLLRGGTPLTTNPLNTFFYDCKSDDDDNSHYFGKQRLGQQNTEVVHLMLD